MPISQEYLSRIKNGEDIAQVIQDYFDDEGDPNYIDSFEELCEMGGSPGEDCDPEYRVTSVELAGNTLTVTCDVFFDEKVFGGGCPDMPTIKPRTGAVDYEINLTSGELHAIRPDYG